MNAPKMHFDLTLGTWSDWLFLFALLFIAAPVAKAIGARLAGMVLKR